MENVAHHKLRYRPFHLHILESVQAPLEVP